MFDDPQDVAGHGVSQCTSEQRRVKRDALREIIAHADTMARNSSTANSNKALEALSACPRQQIHRPVKQLSFELTNHVNAYIDHQRCMLPLA